MLITQLKLRKTIEQTKKQHNNQVPIPSNKKLENLPATTNPALSSRIKDLTLDLTNLTIAIPGPRAKQIVYLHTKPKASKLESSEPIPTSKP